MCWGVGPTNGSDDNDGYLGSRQNVPHSPPPADSLIPPGGGPAASSPTTSTGTGQFMSGRCEKVLFVCFCYKDVRMGGFFVCLSK